MLANSHKFKLKIIVLIVSVVGVFADGQTSCTGSGVCVPIWTCGHFRNLLKISPLPLSTTQFIQRSHCGTFDNVYHVCCYRRGNASESVTTASTTDSTIGKPGSIHPAGVKTGRGAYSGMTLLPLDCGQIDKTKIASGEEANLSEYPWMALLVYDNGTHRTLDCSGSLITDRHVLTAAHCVRVRNKRLVSVRLGEHDTTADLDCTGSGTSRICAPPPQEIDIEEGIYHERYNAIHFSEDIGLLRLTKKALFVSNVKPICLPVEPILQLRSSGQMRIAGWNLINNGTCLGDSGGPIFFHAFYRAQIRYVLYGVISGGSASCGSAFPSIYSRVTPYLPWIESNLI